jgi:nucleotide-binding universal stress UspA family protein
MKKILLAINAANPDSQSIDFACYIGRLTRSIVTGVFLENLVADESPVLKGTQGVPYLDWDIDENSPAYIQKKALIDKNVESFKDCCERKGVRSSHHMAEGTPASEMIAESRYADLIIIDSATSFNKAYEGRPTDFVKTVLKDAECPVLIAPASFEGIDEIVFTFDGSRSAAFAIRQFTNLFPELGETKAVVLHVSKDGEWHDGDKQKFLEWMKMHYSLIGFHVMEGNTDDRLFDYLFKRKNSFIVMGAYGRGALSRFFHHSQADLLINVMTQPIFVSHM